MNAENNTPDQPEAATLARGRRWPRRVAIGVVVTGVVLGGAVWYLGRETTLQMIAQRVANASGGKLTLTGVTGSLYGHMHIGHVVFRTETSVMTGDNIDIDWKPWQYLSRGVEINKLYAQSLRMETLKETDEPATMPERLAPPFKIAVEDARLARLVMVNKGVETPIENIRAGLHGDKQQWKLDYASASTPWGMVAANGTISNAKPYKLAADASLSQDKSQPGSVGAQLKLHAGGDLQRTVIDASGQAARAEGTANLVLSPFAEIPLQALTLNARNIDPGFFNPSLPTADLNLAVAAKLDPNRNISGNVDLTNDGPQGTIDQQRLPLRAMRGRLGGNLSAMQLSDVLLDLGGAGKFTGSGSVQRNPDGKGSDEQGIGTAQFTLHTDRIDLKQIHSSMKPTAIKGDLTIANRQDTQTLNVNLADAGLRLVAEAALANNELTVRQARLSAGKGSVGVTGTANLLDKKPFKVNAVASHLDPAAFGAFPKADINAEINASGALSPQWQVAADFALRPSRLFDQALSGRGKLAADAGAPGGTSPAGVHVHDVNATLALGQNAVDLKGAFGKPGEQLAWRLDGKQLNAVRADLYGALLASGVVTGTMAAPRTTFDVDARGLGWVPNQRKNNNGTLRANGEAWLAGPENARVVEVRAKGGMQRLNPAAFGSPLAGSISGSFDASGRTGANMGGSVNLDILRESTLSNSPLWGYAKLTADKRHVSNADVDLHLGANVVAAKGAFGSGKDTLNWRLDAPQLAALGPDFGGSLRGSGTLSGTMDTPSLSAALEGQNIRLMGTQNLRSLRATANVGAGRGAADPLALDVQVTDYASGETRIAAARLQSTGTRGAHTISAAARGDGFDANVEVRGGLSTDRRNTTTWAGTLQALQNRGRYALTLAAPTPIRIAAAPGAGIAGLAKPEQIAFNGAVVRLPAGSITVDSLSKVGPRWSSRGSATGVPVSYLAQASDAVRQNLRGDLTLGAQWALDMQMPAAANAVPALNGNLHVFREKGDLIAGDTAPVVLGLRQLDLRTDVVGGALRAQLAVDGARIGTAKVDATAQMIRGRLENDSPLRLSANASLGSLAWVSPLIGQPGLELDGALALAVSGAGTVGAPTLNGTINGDRLSARWPDQGVSLRNGQLRAVLAGDQLQLQRLTLEGTSGRATADGNIRFAGGEATMNLRLVADKLAALSRPDRTLIVSGQASVVRDASRFAVEGKFKADRALIELAPVDRPTISDDVIVLGRGNNANGKAAPKEKAVPLTIDLTADLGDDFHLRGMGADAYLAGAVQVRMVGDRPPRINGSVRTVNGTYAAYGQRLSIERGVVNFNGAYDNPSIDILAVRKRPDGEQLSETNVEAGVQVRGTALAPVAKLVSTPNVQDSEKLSWLVLGHGMEGTTGNEADVLSAAAGALLGGKGGTGGIQSKIANSLGLDEFGVRQGQGQAAGLENTVVTVGKRISSRLYLGFEQGAGTASSVVRLRYKVTPQITLQLQTGTNTALDVLYSWAFD